MKANEVSTASGSDRVITSPGPTLTQIEDPVANAPGTDLIIRGANQKRDCPTRGRVLL
jgi:hypothetical protein